MKTSEQISELAAALAIAQGEIKNPAMSGKNTHTKNEYATITDVLNVLKEPLSKNGISFMQSPTYEGDDYYLLTKIIHKSGQWIETKTKLILDKSTMQGLGAATTYARRYSLVSFFGLGDEDDDGVEAEKAANANKKVSPVISSVQAEDLDKRMSFFPVERDEMFAYFKIESFKSLPLDVYPIVLKKVTIYEKELNDNQKVPF